MLELTMGLPGEGAPGPTLASLSFDRLIALGLENSFIFEALLFGSLSGICAGGSIVCGATVIGEGSGLLPFGNAALAAVAAASRFPPSVPLLYGKPNAADDTCGLCVALDCLLG